MNPDKSPSVLVFDVNETLLDITTLEPVFERVFGEAAVMREWFALLILYSQTLTLSGLYLPFGALGVATLKMVATTRGVAVGENDTDELKERMGAMPAHADAMSGLTRLRDAGFRLVTLTNSASGTSPSALERAGLTPFFEHTFSVESVQKFKPAPETYRFVAGAMQVEMADLCLVACHLWDTVGAQAAGCHGALVTRPHNATLPAASVPQPDVTAATLDELAELMIQRWRPG